MVWPITRSLSRSDHVMGHTASKSMRGLRRTSVLLPLTVYHASPKDHLLSCCCGRLATADPGITSSMTRFVQISCSPETNSCTRYKDTRTVPSLLHPASSLAHSLGIPPYDCQGRHTPTPLPPKTCLGSMGRVSNGRVHSHRMVSHSSM